MTINLRKTLFWASIVWGTILLVVGFFASFAIQADESITSLVGLFLMFFLPMIASVVARWIPRIAGITLILAVITLLIGFYENGGAMDVLRVLPKAYLWFEVAFGTMFIVLAKQYNKKTIDAKQP